MLCLAADQFGKSLPHSVWCHQEFAVGRAGGGARELVKHGGHFCAQLRVATQNPKVFVQPCGSTVVVTGAYMHVATDTIFLLAHHKGQLDMGLELLHTVGYMHAFLLEQPAPGDVGCFVESGRDLDQHRYLLAPMAGFRQCTHDPERDSPVLCSVLCFSFDTPSFLDWYDQLWGWVNSDPATRPESPPVNLNNLPDQGILWGDELSEVKLIANVWNGSDDSEVLCQFDDLEPVEAVRSTETLDPYALRNQASVLRYAIGFELFNGATFGPADPQPLDAWLHTLASTHVWTCEIPADLDPGVHNVIVKTQDRHGQTYEEAKTFEVVD